MQTDHRSPNLRALALAVTLLSALTATLLVAQVSTSTSSFAGYGIDEAAGVLSEESPR